MVFLLASNRHRLRCRPTLRPPVALPRPPLLPLVSVHWPRPDERGRVPGRGWASFVSYRRLHGLGCSKLSFSGTWAIAGSLPSACTRPACSMWTSTTPTAVSGLFACQSVGKLAMCCCDAPPGFYEADLADRRRSCTTSNALRDPCRPVRAPLTGGSRLTLLIRRPEAR